MNNFAGIFAAVYFAEICDAIYFPRISRLKKLVETKTKIYLKSKQKNLYIYLYVLRIRIYIHICIRIQPIKPKKLCPRVGPCKGRSPRSQGTYRGTYTNNPNDQYTYIRQSTATKQRTSVSPMQVVDNQYTYSYKYIYTYISAVQLN